MLYRTIALSDLIKKNGKDTAKKVLSDFLCPKNKDVQDFMHYRAYPYEMAGLAKTYLVVAQEDDISHGVCAIYAITTKSITTDPKMPRKDREIAFGTSYAVGNPVNAILIGQLSKNYANGNDKYITGELLMSLIMEHVKRMAVLVPSVSVYVECDDKQPLRDYYQKFGSTFYGINPDGLLQYIIPTKKFISPEYKKKHIKQELKKEKVPA